MKVFVLKFIDVLESYNVNANRNTKIYNEKFHKDLHVYRMKEMFDVFLQVFGKVKSDDMNLQLLHDKVWWMLKKDKV